MCLLVVVLVSRLLELGDLPLDHSAGGLGWRRDPHVGLRDNNRGDKRGRELIASEILSCKPPPSPGPVLLTSTVTFTGDFGVGGTEEKGE